MRLQRSRGISEGLNADHITASLPLPRGGRNRLVGAGKGTGTPFLKSSGFASSGTSLCMIGQFLYLAMRSLKSNCELLHSTVQTPPLRSAH